ncbi:hypothetical protein L9F63_026050, partial [Diploptera punctata]
METSSEIENSLSRKSEDSDDIDLNTKVQTLLERIEKLEGEKEHIREEFGHQRAKMKELYLQKEVLSDEVISEVKKLSSELDEAKSQLVVAGFRLESDLQDEKRKCQEEIASLQQIVQETVEESSTSRSKYECEMKRLRRANERLESELHELRTVVQQHQQQGTAEKGERDNAPMLAPGVMLSAVTKTLARKVVSQLGADASSASQDNLEDSMRKVNKYAQEDAEVLRSLVIPLEEEIQALKEKLRYTDQQLRKYEGDKDDPVKWSEEPADTSCKENVPLAVQNDTTSDVVSPSRDNSVNSSGNKTNQTASSLETDGHQTQPVTNSPKANAMITSSSLSEIEVTSTKKSPDGQSPIPADGGGSEKDCESVGSPVSQGKQPPCDMCSNYEAQLVRAQQRARELEKQVATQERTVDRYREDLAKESDFRKDMEEKWNEKKEEHKIQ